MGSRLNRLRPLAGFHGVARKQMRHQDASCMLIQIVDAVISDLTELR